MLNEFVRLRRATLVVLALASSACTESPVGAPERALAPTYSLESGEALTVMSRNLYLGANIDPILAIQDPNQVPGAIAQAWAAVVASNFPERAKALATEIETSGAQLIGLQEATIYRRQTPSDFVFGNRSTNATVVAYDFVEILLAELAQRGLSYRVVARVVNTDLEFPMFTGQAPLPFDDIRYTDQDVILARADVAVRNPVGQNFAAVVSLPIGGLPVQLKRGWVAVDAEAAGGTVRFTNTHLEVQSFRAVQEAQARELTAWLSASPHTVVLVGDLNSAANADAPPASLTGSYNIFRSAGFADLWLRGNGQTPGLTCCQQPDLRNPVSTLNQRIDFIMIDQGTNQFVGGVQMNVVGDQPADRTPSGLWPSDHAGLVARLHLPHGFSH